MIFHQWFDWNLEQFSRKRGGEFIDGSSRIATKVWFPLEVHLQCERGRDESSSLPHALHVNGPKGLFGPARKDGLGFSPVKQTRPVSKGWGITLDSLSLSISNLLSWRRVKPRKPWQPFSGYHQLIYLLPLPPLSLPSSLSSLLLFLCWFRPGTIQYRSVPTCTTN